MARVCAFWIIGGLVILAAAAGADARTADATAAAANSSDRAALASFKALDHGGNLHLTPDDLSSAGAARRLFALLDRDGDGALSAADGTPARHVLRRLHARTISPGQFATMGATRWLAALDADGDGRLSLAELRPSLAGNAPLDTPPTSPTRPEIVAPPTKPQSCWYFDGIRWVELPGSTPTCRQR